MMADVSYALTGADSFAWLIPFGPHDSPQAEKEEKVEEVKPSDRAILPRADPSSLSQSLCS